MLTITPSEFFSSRWGAEVFAVATFEWQEEGTLKVREICFKAAAFFPIVVVGENRPSRTRAVILFLSVLFSSRRTKRYFFLLLFSRFLRIDPQECFVDRKSLHDFGELSLKKWSTFYPLFENSLVLFSILFFHCRSRAGKCTREKASAPIVEWRRGKKEGARPGWRR